MKLAVLDLDGTLTRTNDVDTDCYLAAFAEEFDIRDLSGDWSAYAHATDAGLADEIFREHYGRPPTSEELSRLQNRFVDLLDGVRREANGHYTIVPGADQFLELLHPSNGWAAVIATGSWSRSAALKIVACGLNISVPLFSCDECITRTDIVRAAVRGSERVYERSEFDRIVLVGDGIWDLHTARELGYPFVGVAEGDRARLLSERGASHVLADFRDLAKAFSALITAAVP